jgi:hypothetical protein
MTDDSREHYVIMRYEADPAGVAAVRKQVAFTLSSWGRQELVDYAVLCCSELASNAVLHCRCAYDVAIRPAGDGVRIEVIDSCPETLPTVIPSAGTAADITQEALTGRGLQIVAAVVSRWGVTVMGAAKSVWVELHAQALPQRSRPELVVPSARTERGTEIALRLQSLPVRAAVMSGVQVDDLVREIQLQHTDDSVNEVERQELYDLLDRSAQLRLSGRFQALDAAAAGALRFDLYVTTTMEAIEATRQLSAVLEALSARPVFAAAISSTVANFRAWLAAEVSSQLAGHPAIDCPLPD